MTRIFRNGYEVREIKPRVIIVTNSVDGTTRRLVGPTPTPENFDEYVRQAKYKGEL